MEHEVVVPLPAEVVREALLDRELMARCVPGLSAVADASSPVETGGRLRLRIGGSTITYAGRLTRREWESDELVVRLAGEEIRGGAAVAVELRITLAEQPGGTVVRLDCAVEADGRLAAFDAETRETVGRRLIDRAAAALVEELTVDGEENGGDEPSATVVYLEDRAIGPDLDDDLSDLIAFGDDEPVLPFGEQENLPEPQPELPYEPEPALAGGPVRRSIVGRSAEEVDHAPPHGRYAPSPPAHSARARAASRWGGVEPTLLSGHAGERSAMPWVIGGGVALIGGAVVLVRALRKR
ncbi:SRPBCC domain-containing protein [Kitasatospora cinereorecta]|uniref:SRPBCC domain-containing protein n=1 Tax=Kitasatospora cinereorecta TaxID=285560 RepID=A0ABW0VNC3_9ACTN